MKNIPADNLAQDGMRPEPCTARRESGALPWQPYAIRISVVSLLFLAVYLRLVALGSDAYARLSWSSGLLTDEGFYIHNARNQVLFGQAHLDGFNNDLIMPVLHYLQVGVFKAFGVGAIQARLISVVLSLLGLPVFFAALRRAFGVRVGVLGVVLLGLDHANLLYSRLALMDPAGAFVLILVFYAFVRGQMAQEEANRRRGADLKGGDRGSGLWWLLVCGFLLGVGYGVRGLTALVMPVPLLVLGWAGWRSRSGWRGYEGLVSCGLGLCLSMGIYLLAWYLPHHQELATVNRYYVSEQLLPHSLTEIGINIGQGLGKYTRGLIPYLFRHSPIQLMLALAWYLTFFVKQHGNERDCDAGDIMRPQQRAWCGQESCTLFLGGWLLFSWALMCFVNYAPSRYYVLFYPPMAGLAALVLNKPDQSLGNLVHSAHLRALFGCLIVYYGMQFVLVHLVPIAVKEPDLIAVDLLITLLCSILLLWQRIPWRSRLFPSAAVRSLWSGGGIRITIAALLLWGGINTYWTVDWLSHITYRQRDADRWLEQNLPGNSVLFGAVAPGLCLNNRFKAVNVIVDLCNDQHPVDPAGSTPQFVVILDDRGNERHWKERWWEKHYPYLVAPVRRIHSFPQLLRPFFTVGLYPVNDVSRLIRTK